jgi:Fe-S-cluster containining protein
MDTATSNTIVQYFQRLYNDTDQRMALLNPVCQRGCPWCCYQSVEILNWEEPLITKYIEENIIEEKKEGIRKNLENWFDFFDRVTKDKAELTMHDAFDIINKQQAKERIPCPFLTNKKCSIYKVRPLSCRCHIAIDNSEKCIENPLLDSTIESERYRKKVVSDIVRNIPTTLRLLAFVVAPCFGIEHRTKPIYYTCLELI